MFIVFSKSFFGTRCLLDISIHAFQLTDLILVMINAAIFTLPPDLSKGKEAIRNSLASTLIGGLTAYIFYWILVAFPEYCFLYYYFLVVLLFASRIFSDRVNGKYYSSVLVALIILFNSSMDEDKDFTSIFAIRLILISLAGVYVTLALKVLDRYWPFSIKQ